MASIKHSELAARLAIEGVVAALAGTVKGQLPVKPRVLGEKERAELGFSQDGEFLFYPLGDSGVFFYTHGAFSTIWYLGADSGSAISVLDATIQRLYPQTRRVSDDLDANEPSLRRRTYDVVLGAGRMAIVESLYPASADANRFSVRVTSMAIKN